jgi:NADH-quinone oxidoreductase subunit M
MNLLTDHLLSVLVFLPLVGALFLLAFPPDQHAGARGFALGVSLVDFVLSLWMWRRFDPTQMSLQLAEDLTWIPSWGIRYSVGVDGIALLLMVMTTLLAPLVILSTVSSVSERIREYLVCVLMLQTAMLGAFVATDLFLFYVFWEAMLIPMYFLVGIWGGKRRIYAALKFFLYTMAGSLLMLVAILYAVWSVKDMGGLTFSWVEVTGRLRAADLGGAESWLFAAFALAFAIKVPMFPFHTWLPDAHVEAPTGGSVILAGVMLKLGTFGFLRYALWLFPHAAALMLPTLAVLATIGILYGAVVAMVQTDLKRLVAYSSVSHLGFVMLGMAAMTTPAMAGSILQMINHGISTGALFLLVGVIYERRHTRELADFGGIAKSMPLYCMAFVFVALSSLGLPGLNGFVGEFMILMGTFLSHGTSISWLGSDAPVTNAQVVGLAWSILLPLVLVGPAVVLARLLRGRTQGTVSRFDFGLVFVGFVAGFLALVGTGLFHVLLGHRHGPLGALKAWMIEGSRGAAPFTEIFATLAVIAASGVIFAAIYMLVAVQRVFFGPVRHPENQHLRDLSGREQLMLAPLLALILFMGVYPRPFLEVIEPAAQHYAKEFRGRAGMPPLSSLQPVATGQRG